jgi:hypothetical protein
MRKQDACEALEYHEDASPIPDSLCPFDEAVKHTFLGPKRMCKRTWFKHVHNGEIPSVVIGGRYYFSPRDCVKALKKHFGVNAAR